MGPIVSDERERSDCVEGGGPVKPTSSRRCCGIVAGTLATGLLVTMGAPERGSRDMEIREVSAMLASTGAPARGSSDMEV